MPMERQSGRFGCRRTAGIDDESEKRVVIGHRGDPRLRGRTPSSPVQVACSRAGRFVMTLFSANADAREVHLRIPRGTSGEVVRTNVDRHECHRLWMVSQVGHGCSLLRGDTELALIEAGYRARCAGRDRTHRHGRLAGTGEVEESEPLVESRETVCRCSSCRVTAVRETARRIQRRRGVAVGRLVPSSERIPRVRKQHSCRRSARGAAQPTPLLEAWGRRRRARSRDKGPPPPW